MTVNVCEHQGWLVDSRELPADPIDHDADGLPRMGCTNIRCAQCGDKVRSVANRSYASPSGAVDTAALYPIEDLAASPQLKPFDGMRFYLCRCAFHVEGNEHRLDDDDVQVATQWTCVGHPIATLPHTFDGMTITADNLEQIVAEAMAGIVPAEARPQDRHDGVWVARLCARLAKTPYADRVAAAAATFLTHPDLATRVRALYFFVNMPSRAAAMRPELLLANHAELFVGVENPNSGSSGTKTLEYLIWHTVSAQLQTNAELRDVAHAFALDPERSSDVVFIALAQNDGEWFRENAAKLSAANPTKRQDLLDAAAAGRLPKDVYAAIRNPR